MNPGDALRVLRESQDRALEREGVPMVLALVSEVDPIPDPSQPAVVADGERVAEALHHFRDELLPTSSDDDAYAVTAVLTAVSYNDFGRTGGAL